MPRYKDAERERIKQETRRRLIEAALEEFAERGYAGANINRISRAAGLAQGTVYNYFPSKRALFEAVVGEIAARHSELVLQGAATASEPAGHLERLLAAGFAFAQGFPAAATVMLSAVYGPDAEIRDLARRAYEPLLRDVEDEVVRAGAVEGRFHPVQTGLAAAVILAVYLGGYAPGEQGGRIRQNPREVAALLLDGLRGGGGGSSRTGRTA
jgi:AcrR family transcriptional regulator